MKQLLKKSMFLLVALSMLTACSGSNSDLTKVSPSGNLQVRCPDLEAPVVGQGQEQYTNYVIDEYHKCAAKDDGLLVGYDVMSYYESSAWGDAVNNKKKATLSNISQVH